MSHTSRSVFNNSTPSDRWSFNWGSNTTNPFSFSNYDDSSNTINTPSRWDTPLINPNTNITKSNTKPKETKQHLIQRLQTNHLIQTVDENVLEQAMTKILQLFNYQQIFFDITKNANMVNLQSIHKIIQKQIKLNSENINNNNQSIDNTNINKTSNNNTKVSLISIGSESIGYICEFLSTQTINKFKLTSREISIICLQQTFKIPLNIVNANNLKYKDLRLVNNETIHSLMTQTRHNPQKKFYSLFEQWEKAYNIPIQNQLVFKIPTYYSHMHFGIIDATLTDSHSMRLNSINGNKYYAFLLCDNRKFVVFDNAQSVRKFNIVMDTFERLKDYKLLILGYLNVKNKNKQTNIAQFVLYKRDEVTYKNILEYIENRFIKLDSMNNKWYDELQCDLQSLINNNNSVSKLCISGETSDNFCLFEIYTHRLTGLQKVMNERKIKWMRVYKERLLRIYNKYEPSKMDNVNKFMNKYGEIESDSDKIHQLYEKVCHKYGLIACDQYTANGNYDVCDENEMEQETN